MDGPVSRLAVMVPFGSVMSPAASSATVPALSVAAVVLPKVRSPLTVSARVAALPACTAPSTVSASLSFRAKSPEVVKPSSVPTLLVPAKLAALALPVSVPAISVPVSDIVPLVMVVTVPPLVAATVPGMFSAFAVSRMLPPDRSAPVIVRSATSLRVKSPDVAKLPSVAMELVALSSLAELALV